jgi:hypothetical protein
MTEWKSSIRLLRQKTFLATAKTGGDGKDRGKMKFLFISGTLSERNQQKSLWFLEGRRARISCPFPPNLLI